MIAVLAYVAGSLFLVLGTLRDDTNQLLLGIGLLLSGLFIQGDDRR